MRLRWTKLPGDLVCDQESMTLKRDGSSRKRRDDRNGKNARIQPHNPTQLTASLVPNATTCFVLGVASSVISAPTPHTSEVMVISEDGGQTSSSSSCIYTLKSMKNEGLSFLFSFLLRYTFHRCCGSSGIAKYVYQPITSQMLNSNPNYNGSFNSKHVRAVSVISNH